MVKNIQCVTIPRSGHHLLTNLLFKYFSNDLNYPEILGQETDLKCKNVILAGNFCYCEFYNHCEKTPCSDPNTNFQKNHDFKLSLVNNPSSHYIIQFKNPLEYLVSWYNFLLKKGVIKEDSRKNWFIFLGIKSKFQRILMNFSCLARIWLYFAPLPKPLKYWKGFIHKWVLENKNTNTYFLPYDKFKSSPLNVLKEVIEFINPRETVNVELVNNIAKHIKVTDKNKFSDFKYFNEHFFSIWDQKLKEELKSLALMN
jgi:hypothetical protein